MNVTRVLADGFTALREALTIGNGVLNAPIDAAIRDDMAEMIDKLEELQSILISLQEELTRKEQENFHLRATVKNLESRPT